MMMKKLILMTLGLCCSLAMYAQTDLGVGDSMPATKAFPAVHVKGNRVAIGSTETQVTVLDFFHTTCVTCIESIPKLMAVQRELGEKVKIIMVTTQDRKTIERFFRTSAFLKDKDAKIPMIVGDTQLKSLFRHRSNPHVIVLKDNIVRAITHSDFVTTDIINRLLVEDRIEVATKDDFRDSSTASEDKLISDTPDFKITRFDDARAPWSGIHIDKPEEGKQKVWFNNIGLYNAYMALWSIIKTPTYLMLPERVSWQVDRKEDYQYPEDGTGPNVWLMKNGFSYERTVDAGMDSVAIARLVMDDLRSTFGVTMDYTLKDMECMVVKEIGEPQEDIQQRPGTQLYEGSALIAFLLDYSARFPPTVDEAGFQGNIALSDFETVPDLNRQLEPYGLTVEKAVRPLEVMVISDIK